MGVRTGLEIAIVGLAGRFPGARDVEELWQNLLGGVDSIVRFSDEDLAAAGISQETLGSPNYVKAGTVLEGIDQLDAELFSLTPREAEVIDPQHRLFLECAWEALESAGCDPETCGGTVGVYAGASLSTYSLLNVWTNLGRLDSLGSLLGFDKDHLATLVSWKLNLTGPSLAVQTACSTSLVAVHLASQGLLGGECDIALAGASSILVPHRVGYAWTEGGVTSSDGSCRTFDAAASGTVFGSGVGVVVLKRLEDALAAGDTIHAVIKGSAINNDGGGRMSYTAPRTEGQTRVVRAAQLMSEVDPDTIGYVEAHGTGTALGDPIEVAALTAAFRAGTERRGFCVLGSIKPNVGHLNAASGIAGLIKAALSLEREVIPPTLHYRQPNPQIDFAASPFYVAAEAIAWPAGEEPRRAAVSSFGMGGTNAHVILEEAPEPEPTTPSRPWQLLVLSARSTAALESATDRLAAHLVAHPEQELADVAHTLQTGRRAFDHRRMALVSSWGEAVRVLAERDPERMLTAAAGRGLAVDFLFPGQGAQHVDMTRGLYETEPAFRDEVDRCVDRLRAPLGLDLREVMFPSPGRAAAAAARLERTALTQPALFTVEYALAKLWMDWGIRPRGMLGHSVGEYVAACLAGVFSLEDALDLVALRGRLMDELPAGAMLAVPLSEEELAPLLGDRLALAAVNGPSLCVVSGNEEEVERLRREVEPRLAAGRECRRLHTSHAFHSAALDPILEGFAAAVGRLSLAAPSLPFISNLTGTWITAEDATDPEYWARHLRRTVRFGEGLATLALETGGVLLEVGPGRALTTLARRHPATADRPALATLRPAGDAGTDPESLLRALGQLWLAGAPVDWPAFYAGERRRRLPLPTYPFERRRYWLEAKPMAFAGLAKTAQAGPQGVQEEGYEPAATYHPRPSLGTAYLPPRNEAERSLAAVWRDLLGISEIGIHDDFFDLGGDSLLVARMAFQVRAAVGVELPLRTFFEARTVARLAAVVAQLRGGDKSDRNAARPPLVPVPRQRELPLSFAQQRLWLLDQLAPGNPFYNLGGALRMTGPLDVTALGRALAEVVRRHEVLRTGFASVEGRPVQRIADAVGWELPAIDLGALPAALREAEMRRTVTAQARLPFDLGRPPLLRAALLRLADAEHVLIFALHHIASDGWSMGVLTGEVAQLYAAFAEGRPSPLPELPVQYVDFAVWQRSWLRGEVLESQLAYWREGLAGAPPVELPTDRPRPPVQTFRGAFVRSRLSAELTAALSALGRERSSSLFMVLLTGFDALISRYTGLEDLVVGTPIAGRTRAVLEKLIGFFVNTLVLRTDLSGDPTVSEILARVRETAVGAYSHQDLPFEHLVEKLQPQRDLSRNPLFQLMFNLLGAPPARDEAQGLTLTRLESSGGTSLFDLQVYLTDTGKGVAASWEYSTDLFDASTMARLARHFTTLLEGMAARPEARLSALPLLGAEERDQVVVAWNATGRLVPAGCVHEWIADQAARSPEAVAVVFGGEPLTYRDLDRRANGLAHRLRELGIGPEVLVGLALERSPEMVVALLAVLKAGGAYVPLDPSYPAERLAYMREDSGLAAVLTRESVLAEEGEPADSPPASRVGPLNAAYMIYTSGSTGKPKGVQISHGALANFLASMAEEPGLGATDALLAVTSLSFDIAGLELYLPLMVGGRVVLASRDEAADGRRLQALMATAGITVLQATPATWRLLLEAGWPGDGKLKALCGGEAMAPALAASLRRRVGSLWNVYGPTETTVWSTAEEIRDGGPISIGRPIANTGAYVLDSRGNPVPVGAAGELLLGGAGLARGYLGRPELTADRFVPDPFGPPGSRLYRTGDLARYRVDGRLDCLGRIDHQVKIRGFRIELGEIEAALGRHPQVEAAVVVVREDGGDRRLVAYLVARRPDLDLAGELRDWARRSLPEHMIPTGWVRLDRLPLTPNGKVDRKALPAPAALGPRVSTAPRTSTEEALAGIWASVLGVEAVGAEDDFFELGGHSLLAAQVVSRIHDALHVELPLSRIFQAPMLSALARTIDAARAAEREEVRIEAATVEPGRPWPLSFAQERLWVLDRMDPGSPAYNIPAGIRLLGALAVPALAASLTEIVRRHAVLRSVIAIAGGQASQIVAAPAAVPLPLIDLRALPVSLREAEARRLANAMGRRAFDLERGPLLRAALARLGDEDHVALFTLHHIASDGWSMGVLIRELSALYAAFRAGHPSPLPEPPIQYLDYARWQKGWLTGGLLEEQLAYWREALAGIEPLRLPTDRPRPPFQTFRGGSRDLDLSLQLSTALRALGQRQGGTLFMVLLAAFSALLHRYSGQVDIPVGSPTANRTQPELEPLIGLFVNTLVLRADLSGAPSFERLLGQVRRSALAAFAHQELPFEKVVFELQPERDLSSPPLFQVMLALQNAPTGLLALPGLEIWPYGMGTGTAKLDLTLDVTETPVGIAGSLEYNADLFDPATIDRMLGQFERLLQAVAADPGAGIPEIALLSAAERHQLAIEASDTAAAYPAETRLHEWIAHQASRQGDAIAVTCGDELLTYGELEEKANRVARYLLGRGVGRGALVGLCMERSLALPVALLGILKAGGAYVPMDPSYPEDRLAYVLGDAGLTILLTGPGAPEWLSPRATGLAVEVVRFEAAEAESVGESVDDPRVPGDPGDLAYVLYTSGSTGRPKGVEIPHRALVNFLASMSVRPGLGAGDVLLAVTSLSFDIAALELYLPLLVGARLDLARRETAADGARLLARLRETGATVLQATPSTWRLLVDAGWTGEPEVRVLCGGEALPAKLADELRARSAAVWNLYGPTETTVWSAVSRVEESGVVLGRPIANTRIVLLDPSLAPAPLGVPGELCIGGDGLARGYRSRPDLTAERFIPNPCADLDGLPGSRLYRTGDLARRRPDGEIEFLGRLDHQVKIRGFRIELGEVESALEAHPQVESAVVTALGEESDRRLVAYLVARGGVGTALSATDLREHLGQRLPDPMIPSAWVLLEALPLTPNGKVDRRALPAPEGFVPGLRAAYVAPRTALEEMLAGIWSEVLRVERIGVQDNFFTLGGQSLLATQVVSRLGEALEIEVPLRRLFEAPTVAGLAAGLLRDSASPEELERSAELVLDLLRLPEDEVEILLTQHAGTGGGAEEAP
ncbi:MAG TPA: amino acid adenylation domain-containing protein [Thermoanaerobaculia bacterium]|nr:amino acid adenylation domain-containing protein [Thermoanaerobaculia bacterium]